MALVNEDKQLPHGHVRLCLQFLDKRIKITDVLFSEFMNQGAEQTWLRLAELDHQIVSAAGAVNLLADASEHTLNLFVEFIPVGKNEHAGVRFVLQDPFRKQNHNNTFAAALRVPDNTALIGVDMLLGSIDPEILMDPREFLHAAI